MKNYFLPMQINIKYKKNESQISRNKGMILFQFKLLDSW